VSFAWVSPNNKTHGDKFLHKRLYIIMAKRIIKNGKYNTITCLEADGGCGCEFAFDAVDIEENGMVICPQCGKENKPTLKPEK
jgi:hypothetical protein